MWNNHKFVVGEERCSNCANCRDLTRTERREHGEDRRLSWCSVRKRPVDNRGKIGEKGSHAYRCKRYVRKDGTR